MGPRLLLAVIFMAVGLGLSVNAGLPVALGVMVIYIGFLLNIIRKLFS